MRRAAAAVLVLATLLAPPARAACAHVVTDRAGDAWAGAVPDAPYDALSADLALTATTLEVVVALAEADLAPGAAHRVVWTGFDLGERRFYAEHRTWNGAASGMLLVVTEEWPATPAYPGASPMTLENVAAVRASVDRARDTLRVSVPLRTLADHGGAVARGTRVGRIDVTTWVSAEAALFTQLRADDAQRPPAQEYRLGDPSCA